MVEPETFTFLAELAQNNRKAWVDQHRDEFGDARRNFTGIAMTLHSYADRFDPFVAEARSKPKQSYTKMQQDPRHRDGPGLYRTGVDIFANAGHPEEDFGYYLHLEPGQCYAGSGLLQPSKTGLNRMQKRLHDDPAGLEDALRDDAFSEMFPNGLFTRKKLNSVPQGYERDDPAAPYLQMAGLGCRKNLPDAFLYDDDAIDTLIEIFRAASPLVRYFD